MARSSIFNLMADRLKFGLMSFEIRGMQSCRVDIPNEGRRFGIMQWRNVSMLFVKTVIKYFNKRYIAISTIR